MEPECFDSEVSPARQPRRRLTGGFLPGLNHRRHSSSQRLTLLEPKTHIHFTPTPPVRQRKSPDHSYFNDEDETESEQEEIHHIREQFRYRSSSTSTETSRVGLRRRPASVNLRASTFSNPVVIIESVALKVRQFTATARATSGLYCGGYGDLTFLHESPVPSHCISADGSSTRIKHTKRKSSPSSSPPGSVRPTPSNENPKPLGRFSGNGVTSSGEGARNANNRTGATTSCLNGGAVASASVSSTKPRNSKAKVPGSSKKKSRSKVKEKEKSSSKLSKDSVSDGTRTPTSSVHTRTKSTSPSKRPVSPLNPAPQSSGHLPAAFNVDQGLANTTTSPLSNGSSSIHLGATSSFFPAQNFFSADDPLDFVFPSFDPLDDLIRWDTDSMLNIMEAPDLPGSEYQRNDTQMPSHQTLSNEPSFTSTRRNAYDPHPFDRASESVAQPPSIPKSGSPTSSISTCLFSTPFDDEPIAYESHFPSIRRPLMEDTRIKKSKTIAADKARKTVYSSNVVTSTLLQNGVFQTNSSTPSGSTSPHPFSSPPSSVPVRDSLSMLKSTSPSSPLPHVPSPSRSDSKTPSAPTVRSDESLNTYLPAIVQETRPSLPSGLPSPLLPPYNATPTPSRSTTPVPMCASDRLDTILSQRVHPSTSGSSNNVKPSTAPRGYVNTIFGPDTPANRRSASVPIPPQNAAAAPHLGLITTTPVQRTAFYLDAGSSPSTSSASDSGYGSANMQGHGRKRSSPHSADHKRSKRKYVDGDDQGGEGSLRTTKGYGGTTRTWTDSSGYVHLGAEDCVLEVLFPQAADFEVWDMSDGAWAAVPVLLYLKIKDATRWIGTPLAMPDVTHMEVLCEDVPIPVPFDALESGTTLSASSSTFYSNTYTTSFQGGKSALEDFSYGSGKSYPSRSNLKSSDKGRGLSMVEALRKKEEEQTMKPGKISIDGRWLRTFDRPGVSSPKGKTSNDFLYDEVDLSPNSQSMQNPGREEIKHSHRGWYLKLWILIPTRLFVKRETRVFRVQAKAWLMGDEEQEEKGLRRGGTLLDKFEIGMEEVEKWLGETEEDEEEEEVAEPLMAETEMTVSHLRKEREMDRSF